MQEQFVLRRLNFKHHHHLPPVKIHFFWILDSMLLIIINQMKSSFLYRITRNNINRNLTSLLLY